MAGFQDQFFAFSLYAGVVTSANYTNAKQMIHRQFELIEYGMVNNFDNQVLEAIQRDEK